MRILFINSIRMFGGGEIWLLTMMHALRERGHYVSLLCRPDVPLENRAKRKGFSVFTLSFRGDFDPILIYRTWKLIRKLKIDIVCTNMDKELRFGGIAARLAGIRAIVPRRGIDYPLKNTAAYRFSYNHIASGVIANSLSTKQTLMKNCYWLNPEKIRVIYNGIEMKRFSGSTKKNPRTELGIPGKNYLYGFVGQLDKRKGVETLLESFAMLSQKNRNTTLLMVGEGKLRSRLEKMAGQCKGQVVFAGFRDDIPDIMKSIDALVLPSLWEGFGIVLIEAMAAGKPVITTNVSNMPEIISEGREGYLVSPSDSEDLQDAMRKLFNHPAQGRKMGKNGRETVRLRFTLKRMVDDTESYFLEQLKINERIGSFASLDTY